MLNDLKYKSSYVGLLIMGSIDEKSEDLAPDNHIPIDIPLLNEIVDSQNHTIQNVLPIFSILHFLAIGFENVL